MPMGVEPVASPRTILCTASCRLRISSAMRPATHRAISSYASSTKTGMRSGLSCMLPLRGLRLGALRYGMYTRGRSLLQRTRSKEVLPAHVDPRTPRCTTGWWHAKIGGGAGFGAGIRVFPSAKLGLLFDFMRLAASTSKEARIDGMPVAVDIQLPASAFSATAGYFRTTHRLRYGLGAGVGYYICNGKIEARVGTERRSSDVTAKGPGFQALAMGDIRASSLHFEVAIGYRSAKTNLQDEGGADVLGTDGSRLRADWSGLMTRFGFSSPFDPGPYPTSGR